MSLTSAEQVDVRRFLGYSLSGNTTIAGYRELVYSAVSYMGISLDTRLTEMTSDEETVVRNKYLVPLNSIEDSIANANSNLDTDRAAVWFHNKDEVRDRTNLFNQLRRQLCEFLGFPPGPLLGGAASVSVIRC